VSVAAPPAPAPRGSIATRIDRKVLLGIVAGGLAGLLVVSALVLVLRKPGAPASSCSGSLCPPQPGSPGLVSLTSWKSDLGFLVEYDDSSWTVSSNDGTNLKLQQDPGFGDLAVWVQGFRAGEGSPSDLIGKQLDGMQDSVVGLARDDDPADKILGPMVGFVNATGATYQGTARNSSGPGGSEWVYVLAATDGKITVVVSASSTESDYQKRAQALNGADTILDYVRFPEQLG